MEKIILHREEKGIKTKRHSVIVENDIYMKLIHIQTQTGMTMEKLVNTLLEEAIKLVEIQDE